MAPQKEIRVGSIVQSPDRQRAVGARSCGIVLAYPSQPRTRELGRVVADVYWFKKKITDWEYISYLEVLVR